MEPIVYPPSDGFTNIEKLFMKEIFISMYKSLRDPVLQLIIIAHFECGYTQDEIAEMLRISQPTVFIKLQKAQNKLKKLKKCGRI